MGTIYKITNRINGKIYIGQTSRTIKKRLKQHIDDALFKKGYCSYLASAIKKYGAESFHIEPIISALHDDFLDELEIGAIREHNAREVGYNLTDGGGGRRGYKCSAETKLKMSKSNKGKVRSEQAKKNISIARTGVKNTKKYSEETLIRKSLAMSGENNPMFGKEVTVEHKRKLSEALLGEKSPFFGIPKSEDIKTKLRLSQEHRVAVEVDGVQYNSQRDAAKVIGVDKKTIARWIKSGKATKLPKLPKEPK